MGVIGNVLALRGVHKPRDFGEVHGVQVVKMTPPRKTGHWGIHGVVLARWHDSNEIMRSEVVEKGVLTEDRPDRDGLFQLLSGWRSRTAGCLGC